MIAQRIDYHRMSATKAAIAIVVNQGLTDMLSIVKAYRWEVTYDLVTAKNLFDNMVTKGYLAMIPHENGPSTVEVTEAGLEAATNP
jgi:hypothetical protein